MQNRKHVIGTCAIAIATGVAGLWLGSRTSIADDKPASAHQYKALMQQHLQMAQGADGAAKMKEMMLMMSAHQYVLGEMAESEDVKKLAQTPEMKQAIEQVKAILKDHPKLDAKKTEVAKQEKEAMMILGHALLKQDKEAEQMLKSAEEGKD